MASPVLTMTMSLRAVLINVGRFIGSICEDKTKPHQPSPAHTGFNTIDMSQMRLWGWQVPPVALAQVSLMHKPNATWLPSSAFHSAVLTRPLLLDIFPFAM